MSAQIGWWVPVFGTKRAGKQVMREIVARAGVGSALVGADLEVALMVFGHHPQWDSKRGTGVDLVRVVVYPHVYGSNLGFEIVRVDGSVIDISWVTCFDGQPHDREVKQAARVEIAGQRTSAAADGLCSICGAALQPPVQVDHAPPLTFERILSDFMSARALAWDDIRVVSHDGLHNEFADRALAMDWQAFHAERAVLRIVHKACNLSLSRRDGGR